MEHWWCSSPRMTVAVELDESDRIIDGPPVVRRFIGQPMAHLVRWMRTRHGGGQLVQLHLGEESQGGLSGDVSRETSEKV